MLTRSYVIADYSRKHPIRKLQMGAGSSLLEDWLNTALWPTSGEVFLDAGKPFPIRDEVFDYVFCEHLIEHLDFKQGLFMLRQINRILKPNGKVRIATPDLATLVQLYSSIEKSSMQKEYVKSIIANWMPAMAIYANDECFVLNNAFRGWGHQFIYDDALLRVAMEVAGFVNITRHICGESDDEVFQNIESHGKAIGEKDVNPLVKFETMVLEGCRS